MTVECRKCQTSNPNESKFCNECATPLPGAGGAVPTKTIETPHPQFSSRTILSDRYEIIRELGKGGMGEVYLAEDNNLKRNVAIKVLPQHFALDKERLARFGREARLLASLNHPNIATIHGLEKTEDQKFLVMELVEGETLAELIKRGSLPVEEALKVCLQIAEGLESAHEKGIIHRDLKPANIKVTPEGKVKILDFGIAKAFQDKPDDIDTSKSPAITDEMTEPGMILGTAAYMSPEQAKGKAADRRSDIWAFGCILYECLTGKRTFRGDTISETMASILKDEPDWNELPATTHTEIRKLIRRCLRKDANQRLHHIADGRLQISETLEDPIESTAFQSLQIKNRPLWKRALPWFVASLMGIIAIIALWNILNWAKPEDNFPIRFKVNPPEGQLLNVHTVSSGIAISPDGRNLVYPLGFSLLYLRSMDSLETSFLAPGGLPFFSPDGKWIGFSGSGGLKKISINGGSLQDICEIDYRFWGGSWGPDGTIIFSDTGILWKVSALGGKREQLLSDQAIDQEGKKENYCIPQHLPNGKAILFTIVRSADDMSIALLDLKTHEEKIIIDKGTGANYVPSGHIVFSWGNDLFAIKFDVDRNKVIGNAFPIVQDAAPPLWHGQSLFSVSKEGTLAYIPASAEGSMRLVWVDRQGKVERLPLPPALYGSPRVSPNGKTIIYAKQDEKNKIWIYDLERRTTRRLMDEQGDEWLPTWTPDGLNIAFVSTRENELHGTMFWKSVDSDLPAEVLVNTGRWPCPHSFSPDGKLLAYRIIGEETDYDIWLLPLDGTDKPEPFLQTQAKETWPKFSPDGKWIVYQSSESGQVEVYFRPVSSSDGKSRQISNAGGKCPLWSPDGTEIFYATEDKIMLVSFQGESEVRLGTPQILFEWSSLLYDDFSYGYDIAPDGQRFLMIEGGNPQSITVVLNWLEELKRKIQE